MTQIHRSRSPLRAALGAVLATALVGTAGAAADWPQWFGPERDGVWRETGLLERFPKGGPKVLWRAPLNPGFCGPAEADGRVVVMDRERARGPDGELVKATRQGSPGNERVLCFDAATGKELWKHQYDCPYRVSWPSGPRTTPLIDRGRVYTLGTMGDLCCLEAATGKLLWSKNLAKEYKVATPPPWGYSAHLLVEGDLLISLVGGEGSAVVALDKHTGKEVWKALTTQDIAYSPPMVYEAGGKRQLIVWPSESITSLDPATGKVYWTLPYPSTGQPKLPSVNISTILRMGDQLFFTSTYHGPLMLTLDADKPGASVVWSHEPANPEKPESLCCLMPSPALKDGYVYGVSFMGELMCLDAATGKELWQNYDLMVPKKKTDCGTAFLIRQGDRFVIFTETGDLVFANLTPKGYQEIDRAHIIDAVQAGRGRMVVWSHPAFARRCVFARNDKEIVCVSLAAEDNADPKPGK